MSRLPFPRRVLAAAFPLAASLAGLSVVETSHAATFPRYRVVDLGPGNAQVSQPQAGAAGADHQGRPTRWIDGRAFVLPSPQGQGIVVGLNASGVMAGDVDVNFSTRPARWSPDGQLQDLGLPGETTSVSGLDDAGTVIGYIYGPQGPARTGFIVDPDGTRHPFPMYGAGDTSLPLAISPDGVVGAEVTATAGGERRCAFYANGTFQVLDSLPGYQYCSPVAVNRAGHLLATSGGVNGAPRAVLWRDGAFIDLGSFDASANPRGMNANDVVVGYTGKRRSKQTENFIWADGVMRSLDTLMDASAAGWQVKMVNGIDDDGRISGYGRPPGKTTDHAILLVPVPR